MLVARAAKHLARRGYEAIKTGEKPAFNISTEDAVLLTILLVTVIFAVISLIYTTFGSNIILTLTAVEANPDTTDYAPIATEDESKEALLVDTKDGKDEEVPPPPYQERPTTRITSSLRATIRHLRREDGLLRFPFRGMKTACWYVLAGSLLGDFIGGSISALFGLKSAVIVDNELVFLPNVGMIFGQELAILLLANMAVVVTHAQISSAETNKAYGRGFKRAFKASWKVALPTLVPTAIISLSTIYTNLLAQSYIMDTINEARNSGHRNHAIHGDKPSANYGCAVASVLITMLLSLVAAMALLRIQASSFPREDKTVVPVNFGFGMIPESNEVKVLSFCQALRSYKKADLVALFKMGLKLALVSTAVHVFLGAIIFYVYMILAIKSWRF